MKRFIVSIALLISVVHAAQDMPPRSPEVQFHYDVSEGYLLLSKETGEEHRRRIREIADGIVAHLKESEPLLFDERAKLIADEEIEALVVKLIEWKTERGLMSFPIWRQYLPLWKEKKLNRTQKVFMVHFAQWLWKEHEEIQRRRSEYERANKAPEPTPGAVTPRATEGTSK